VNSSSLSQADKAALFQFTTEAVAQSDANGRPAAALPLVFYKVGTYFYVIGWAALYAAAMTQTEPTHEVFETPLGDRVVPVVSFHEELIENTVPRMLSRTPPLVIFEQKNAPASLQNLAFKNADGSIATPNGAQA
jgi:hypothetical protein